jgi:hypothetical protein
MNAPVGGPEYDPKNLQAIFFVLLAAQVFFFFMAIFSIEEPEFEYELKDLSFTLIPLATLVLDIVGNRVFTSGLSSITTEDLEKSLQKLARIHLIRWALVEIGTLLLIVFAMLYNNHFFSAFALANIIYFITLRPKLFTFNEGLQ